MEDKAKSLERFVEAQAFASVYERALNEVKNGMKVGHWIWYIFPQVKGLGMSYNSQYYGIEGLDEAREYLCHPLLGKRLKEVTTALLELQGKSAEEVFGGLDAMKVHIPPHTRSHSEASSSLFRSIKCPNLMSVRQ